MKSVFIARDQDGRLFEFPYWEGMVATEKPHKHVSAYPFDGNFYVEDVNYRPAKGRELDASLYPHVTYENSPILVPAREGAMMKSKCMSLLDELKARSVRQLEYSLPLLEAAGFMKEFSCPDENGEILKCQALPFYGTWFSIRCAQGSEPEPAWYNGSLGECGEWDLVVNLDVETLAWFADWCLITLADYRQNG